MSSHAKTAKAIRADLAKAYPTVKFTVHANSFAGGDDVRVSWVDGPTTDDVDKIIGKYEYGHYDGMHDIYEYDNSHPELPQVKYVMTSRGKSDETRALLIAEIEKDYGGTYSDNRDYSTGNGLWGSQLVWQMFSKRAFMPTKPTTTVAVAPTQEATDTNNSTPSVDINIVDYSEKAIAVFGNTKPHKDVLGKQLHGVFNFHLKHEGGTAAGWIFPKFMEKQVKDALKIQ